MLCLCKQKKHETMLGVPPRDLYVMLNSQQCYPDSDSDATTFVETLC